MSGRVHDVVIVGSGIGGLTAGALCAADGLDVVVLEGHTRPGGCAGDFVRRRVLFPAGSTVVMGFEEGGLHRWVYERLGIPIRARRLDLAMTVHLPDRDVAVHTDRAAWDAERRRAFPELGAGGERFWSRVQRLGAIGHRLAGQRPVLPIAAFDDLRSDLRLLGPDVLRAIPALPALWQTVADLLGAAGVAQDIPHRRFVDNQLLISMQCLADESVALSGALALDVYRQGTFSLPAGTATIAHDLIGVLQRHGGTIRYRAWAQRIARHADRWIVTTADGEYVEGRAVVANVPPTDLAQLLGSAAPAKLREASRRRVQPWGAVVLYAALDPTGMPADTPGYHQIVDTYHGALEDGGSAFVSLFGPQPGRDDAPARLTVSTHTRVEPWWRLPDRPAYLERKHAIGERLLRSAERAIPNVRGRVRFSEVASPRTFQHWTGRQGGRVGGLAQTRANASVRALSHRVGLPGLFLCGDSTFPGQGTIGVTLSGIIAASSATRHVQSTGQRWWPRLAHFSP